jgi:hypothetical protein
MALRVGDRVEQQARSTTRGGRAGVIRTVVHGEPSPRYVIRWDDGRETVYTPAAGSLHLQSSGGRRQPRKRAAGKAPAKKTAGKATAKSATKTAQARKPSSRKSR